MLPSTWGLSREHLGRSPYCPAARGLGSHLPSSQAEHSEPLPCPGLFWGSPSPFQGKSLSLHVSDQLQRTQFCGREDGGLGHAAEAWPTQGLLSRLIWSPSPSLRCLSHIRKLPSLGPQSIPDTPWGLPVELLALRGSCSAGLSSPGQASVAGTARPHPLLTSPPTDLEPPGQSRRAGWAHVVHCLEKRLSTDTACLYRPSVCPQIASGFGLQKPGEGLGGRRALWLQKFTVESPGRSWNELCRGSGGSSIPVNFPGTCAL